MASSLVAGVLCFEVIIVNSISLILYPYVDKITSPLEPYR